MIDKKISPLWMVDKKIPPLWMRAVEKVFTMKNI
jgi:hypothetical protein